MKTSLTITIKKRTQSCWLTMVLILFPFALGTLNDLLGLPYGLRYILDVVWLLLVPMLFVNQRLIRRSKTGTLLAWGAVFLLYTLLSYTLNFQSPLYYLWGVRNNFRYYVVFIAFAAFLTLDDIETCLDLFDKLFWIDIVISLFQFFVLDFEQDYLGGIFGTEIGCNGYTNIFFLIVVTKSVVFYLGKKESMGTCISKCVAALLVAALAELKFFFVEFLMVIALAVLFANFTWRKLLIVVGGVSAAFVGAYLITYFFPIYVDWFTLEWILEVATASRGYTSQGDLNRLTAIGSINDLWLKTWDQRLFGLGLGNCDTSSYEFLNTPFFRQNGDMHYSWISYAHMYLECGWIGLIFYIGFFVCVYFAIQRIEKRGGRHIRQYCQITKIMAVMCVMLAIYNASLRAESGYMVYFVLAIPFALEKQYSGKAGHFGDTIKMKSDACDNGMHSC